MAQAVFGGPASIKLQLEGQTFANLLQLRRETNKIIRGYSTACFRFFLGLLRDSGLNDINERLFVGFKYKTSGESRPCN